MSLAAATREALAAALRSRVAGPDAAARAEVIWHTPGERWFRNADPIARVNGNATMYVGGIRALLLQSLHPLAMAGVAGHSGYQDDPWGRLQRTADYVAATTFARIDDATAVIDRVRAVHRTIRGTAPDGREYYANDPYLLRWVHCAEIESFLVSHQTYGRHPLTPAECDTYVAQCALTADLLGVGDPPESVGELYGALASYGHELAFTDASRDVIELLLRRPPLPAALRPGYWMLAAGAVAILPVSARRLLGLPSSRVVDVVARPCGHVSTAAVRWALGQATVTVEPPTPAN